MPSSLFCFPHKCWWDKHTNSFYSLLAFKAVFGPLKKPLSCGIFGQKLNQGQAVVPSCLSKGEILFQSPAQKISLVFIRIELHGPKQHKKRPMKGCESGAGIDKIWRTLLCASCANETMRVEKDNDFHLLVMGWVWDSKGMMVKTLRRQKWRGLNGLTHCIWLEEQGIARNAPQKQSRKEKLW